MISRPLLSSVAALALAAVATPAMAQLADVSIEGPISGFAAPATDANGVVETAPNGRPIVGVMTVMGATVKVPRGAPIHTPTNADLNWRQFSTGQFPGRAEEGFLGGTAIVTGDSVGGVIYANDVFSDVAENVVVGEATAAVVDGNANRATVNNIPLVPSRDARMPAGRPINGFGFDIDPTQIDPGSLVSVEGYYGRNGRLYYHTLEADGAAVLYPTVPEVSILRADCRKRGGGRDELEVRGGTKAGANGRVTIQYLNADGVTWTSVAPTAPSTVDNTVTPAQGLYRYTSSALRLPGTVCPAQVRAVAANGVTASPGFTPDAR